MSYDLQGYYIKFVNAYGEIAWPLTKNLKKDFDGMTGAIFAFQDLKHVMTT